MNLFLLSDVSALSICLITIVLSFFLGYRLAEARKKEIKKLNSPREPATGQTVIEKNLPFEKKMMLEETIGIIRQLSENISHPLNINELGKEIVNTTAKILGVEICVLLLLDESNNLLTAIASTGIDQHLAQEIKIRKGEELSGLVAQYNETRIINNLQEDQLTYNLKYDKCYRDYLISSPVSLKNKVLGVLNIGGRKSDTAFSAVDTEILHVIALESAIALQNLKLLQQQRDNYLNTIIALASALDARDPYTYKHSENVTKYALLIAREIKLPSRLIEDLRYAALLHDIGKIGIRDGILMKPEALTDEEYAQIKLHPVKGEEIIKSLAFLQGATKIIRHHHERFDGQGYPDGIAGEKIELCARILVLADSFDAMTTKRVYRDALNLEEAKDELIKKRGTQFDPSLTDQLLAILEKEPQILEQNTNS